MLVTPTGLAFRTRLKHFNLLWLFWHETWQHSMLVFSLRSLIKSCILIIQNASIEPALAQQVVCGTQGGAVWSCLDEWFLRKLNHEQSAGFEQAHSVTAIAITQKGKYLMFFIHLLSCTAKDCDLLHALCSGRWTDQLLQGSFRRAEPLLVLTARCPPTWRSAGDRVLVMEERG